MGWTELLVFIICNSVVRLLIRAFVESKGDCYDDDDDCWFDSMLPGWYWWPTYNCMSMYEPVSDF